MASFAQRAPRARRTAAVPFLVVAALGLAPGAARAGDVTFVFTGTVRTVDAEVGAAGVEPGDSVYGTYTFDADSRFCSNTATEGRCQWVQPPHIMTVVAGSRTFYSAGLNGTPFTDLHTLVVVEPGRRAGYVVESGGVGSDAPLTPWVMDLMLDDPTGTALPDTLFPLTPPDLARFASRMFVLYFPTGAIVADVETLVAAPKLTYAFAATLDRVDAGFAERVPPWTAGTRVEGDFTYGPVPATATVAQPFVGIYEYPAPAFGMSLTGAGVTLQTTPYRGAVRVVATNASTDEIQLDGFDVAHQGLVLMMQVVLLDDSGALLQDGALPGLTQLAAAWPRGYLSLYLQDPVTGEDFQAWGPLDVPAQTLTVARTGAGSGRVVSMSPAGLDCGATCSLSAPAGAAVTLTAWPDPGSTFAGWSGACTGAARACTVTLDAARSVSAAFGKPAAMSVIAWGASQHGQTPVPPTVGDVLQVSAGEFHSLAVRTDHTVAAWGDDGQGQTDVPAGLGDVVAVAAGGYHSLALKRDGTVQGWGADSYGAASPPAGLTDVVAISAGNDHSLALRRDGKVVAWGFNGQGQAAVPAGLDHVVAIAAGLDHNLALKTDGTVVAWGSSYRGETIVPADVTGVVAVAAGAAFSLALRADGTVRAWGGDVSGTGVLTVPAGLGDARDVSACVYRAMALRADGTVVEWGQLIGTPMPAGLGGVTAIAAGQLHAIALVPSTSLPTYTLTVAQVGAGGRVTSPDTVPALACTGASCTAKAVVASTVTLTAESTDPARYVFKGWSGCSGGSGSTCVVPMFGDHRVVATFEPATFALTLAYAGTGSGTVAGPSWDGCTAAGCTATVANGAVVTLSAQAGAGNVFEGWGILCAGTAPTCAFTMNSTKTVQAAFEPAAYPVSVSLAGAGAGSVTSAPAGIACGAGGACAASFANGATVTLAAAWDATRYQFTGWSGGICGGTAPTCAVAMNAAKSVSAIFDPLTYPLSVTVTGAGAGTVTSTAAVGTNLSCATGSPAGCTASFAKGASVTITATPADASSIFGAWSGCSSVSGNRCTVAMTSARSLTASFLPATYPLTVTFGGTGKGTVSGTANGAAIAFSCGAACTAPVANGASVVLSATASAGSTFKSWGVLCTGTGPCAFKMNAAKSPSATFSSP
jgi:hypothetical protein